MKILLFLLSAFCIAIAKPPPQCIDPTFACQDLQSAKLCGVVQDCIDDVWSKMTVPDDNDEVCDICKEMVKEARDQLLSNMTQEEIKEVFEGSCKLLPIKLVADACIKVVDEIIPQLVEMLASRMDPTMVCTVSGMCYATRPHQIPKVNDDLECEFCEHVLEHVKQLITTNTTMDEFRNALLNFCNHTGSFSGKCNAFVNDYFDMIFNFIKKMDTKGMCTLMGLCTNSHPLVKVIPSQPSGHRIPLIRLLPAQPIESNDIQPLVRLIPAQLIPKKTLHEQTYNGLEAKNNMWCDFCKEAMAEVEKQLNDPATKQQLKQMAEGGCNMLPQQMHDDCISFIDQNIDALFDILQQELKPDTICPALGICPAASRVAVSPRVRDLECDVCKDVVSSFRQKLQDPQAKVLVQTFLEEACTMLPTTISQDCKKFVDDNIDFILTTLISETDPQRVCSLFSICPAPAVTIEVEDVECDLCKEVVSKVEDMVKDKRTEDEIKSALDSVCSYLPKSISAKCVSFVNQYTDLIVELLMQELDPATVCAELQLCPASRIAVKAPKNPVKDMECDLCKDVVNQVFGLIKDKKTEDEIQSALDSVCSILPSSLSTKCEKFVNQYTKTIITLLMMELNPDMVCAALKVCPAQDLECQSCQDALHFIQEQLMNPDTQARVKELFERVCAYLPNQQLQKNCNDFVEEYGASLLTLISQEIDPSILCSKMHMCTNQTIRFLAKPVAALDSCKICEAVVQSVDKLLEEDSVDQDLTQLVEKVCSFLPSQTKAQCDSILQAYGPYILQMIGQLADPTQLCQDIDLCARPPTHVHLIGGSKCTFGPSYWCTTPEHATACKAEKFCREKVW